MKIDAQVYPALSAPVHLKTVIVSQGDTAFPPGAEWCYASARDVYADERIPQGSEPQLGLLGYLYHSPLTGPCFLLELGPGTPAEGLASLKSRADFGKCEYFAPQRWFGTYTADVHNVALLC